MSVLTPELLPSVESMVSVIYCEKHRKQTNNIKNIKKKHIIFSKIQKSHPVLDLRHQRGRVLRRRAGFQLVHYWKESRQSGRRSALGNDNKGTYVLATLPVTQNGH